MTTYLAKNGQSIYDVCLQTYGSLNFLYKLIKDNSLLGINDTVQNKKIIYDESLVEDFSIFNHNDTENIFYITGSNQTFPGLLANADGIILDTAAGIDIAIA